MTANFFDLLYILIFFKIYDETDGESIKTVNIYYNYPFYSKYYVWNFSLYRKLEHCGSLEESKKKETRICTHEWG